MFFIYFNIKQILIFFQNINILFPKKYKISISIYYIQKGEDAQESTHATK